MRHGCFPTAAASLAAGAAGRTGQENRRNDAKCISVPESTCSEIFSVLRRKQAFARRLGSRTPSHGDCHRASSKAVIHCGISPCNAVNHTPALCLRPYSTAPGSIYHGKKVANTCVSATFWDSELKQRRCTGNGKQPRKSNDCRFLLRLISARKRNMGFSSPKDNPFL